MLESIISLITTAIIKGCSYSIEKISAEIVYEGYQKLRVKIIDKYPSINISEFEKQPNSINRQKVLEEEIRNSSIMNDQEIVHLSEEVIDALEKYEGKNYKFDANDDIEETLEVYDISAGRKSLREIVDNHLKRITFIRTKKSLSSQAGLLSDSILQEKKVPKSLRKEVNNFPNELLSLTEIIAYRIQERKYEPTLNSLDTIDFSYDERVSASRLMKSELSVGVSLKALQLSTKLFIELNDLIIESYEAQGSKGGRSTLITNAILVYEFVNFLINYFENFKLVGADEIRKLHAEANLRIEEARAANKKVIAKLNKSGYDKEDSFVTTKIERTISREKSLSMIEGEWNRYVKSILSTTNEVKFINNNLRKLEIMKDDAYAQLKTLEAMDMLVSLKECMQIVENFDLTLDKIQLITLTPERLKNLLKI